MSDLLLSARGGDPWRAKHRTSACRVETQTTEGLQLRKASAAVKGVGAEYDTNKNTSGPARKGGVAGTQNRSTAASTLPEGRGLLPTGANFSDIVTKVERVGVRNMSAAKGGFRATQGIVPGGTRNRLRMELLANAVSMRRSKSTEILDTDAKRVVSTGQEVGMDTIKGQKKTQKGREQPSEQKRQRSVPREFGQTTMR